MRLLSLRGSLSVITVSAVVTAIIYAPLFWGAVGFIDSLVLSLLALVALSFWILAAILNKKNSPLENAGHTGIAARGNAVLYALAVCFVLLVALQILPLGQFAVRIISPEKWRICRDLQIPEAASALSVNPYTTEMYLYRVIGYAALFFVVSKLAGNRKIALTLAGVITAVAAVTSFYGVMQYLTDNQLPALYTKRYYLDRATGQFVNANHFAGFLEICLPISLSLLFIGRRRQRTSAEFSLAEKLRFFLVDLSKKPHRLVLLAAVVLLSLGIVFSMSRLGILSAAVSLLTFLGLVTASARSKFARLSAVLAVTAVIVGANILMGLDEVAKRYSVLFDRDVGWRTGVWSWSAKVALDYPIVGTGLGTFQFVSPMYKRPGTNAGQFDEAHNDYLNLWSDTGTVGLLTGIAFVVVWFVVVFRRMRKLRTYQNFLLAGCVSSLVAMLVHSIGDFNLQIPCNAAFLAIVLGMGVALTEQGNNERTVPAAQSQPGGAK